MNAIVGNHMIQKEEDDEYQNKGPDELNEEYEEFQNEPSNKSDEEDDELIESKKRLDESNEQYESWKKLYTHYPQYQ